MSYELWDTDTGNLLRSYEGIDEALGLVRSAVASYGRRYVNHWALVRLEEDGTPVTIAVGAALERLAAEAMFARPVSLDS
jgi:hypothetical protein